jgi:hypothetical protein
VGYRARVKSTHRRRLGLGRGMNELVMVSLLILVVAGWVVSEIKERANQQALLDLATEIISNQIGQTADLLDRLMASSFGEYTSSFACEKSEPEPDNFQPQTEQIYDDDGIIE